MEFGICTLGVIPVRSEPSHRAEMTSQILFGECYQVIDSINEWALVHTSFDHYEGWINITEITRIKEKQWSAFTEDFRVITDKIPLIKDMNDNISFPVPSGSSWPTLNKNIFQINGKKLYFSGNLRENKEEKDRSAIADHALRFLNAPYLWGGRTHMGIDCSGFTQIVGKMSGFRIERDAAQQALEGETVGFVSEARPCDLAFFDDEEGNIVHAGIIIQDDRIIHASGRVRIDRIDHQGIFNAEKNEYTHQLRVIKRIF